MTAPVIHLPLTLAVVVRRLLVMKLPSMHGVDVTAGDDGTAYVACPTSHVAWNAARILHNVGFAVEDFSRLLVVRGMNHHVCEHEEKP